MSLYCASKFKDDEELSKHMDRIHHGFRHPEVTHEDGEPVNSYHAHICSAFEPKPSKEKLLI
jgi:hypothetical protein